MSRHQQMAVAFSLLLAQAPLWGCVGEPPRTDAPELMGRVAAGTARVPGRSQFVTLTLPDVMLLEGQTILWNGVVLKVEKGGVWLPPGFQAGGEVPVSVPGRGTFRVDPGRLKDGMLVAIGTMGPEGAAFVRLTLKNEALADGQRLTWAGQSLQVLEGGTWLPQPLLSGGAALVTVEGKGSFNVDPAWLRQGQLALDGSSAVTTQKAGSGAAVSSDFVTKDALIGANLLLTDGTKVGLTAGLELLTAAAGGTPGQQSFGSSVGGGEVTASQLLTVPGSATRDPITGALSFNAEGKPSLLNGGASLLTALKETPPLGSLATPGVAGVVSSNGGSLVTNNSGSLISNNSGGSLISNNSGGSLISNNSGGSLVTNNAAAIAGFPYFPVAPPPAKLQLLALTPLLASMERLSANGVREYLWPGSTTVRAIRSDGKPLTGWVTTNQTGAFQLKFEQEAPLVFFVQAKLSPPGPVATVYTAYALAVAPAQDAPPVVVPVDANTTLTTGATLHLLTYIPPEILRLTGLVSNYETEVASLLDPGKGQGDPAASDTTSSGSSKVTTEEQAAIDAFQASIDAALARTTVLKSAWGAFNPLQYTSDLRQSDRALSQADAEANARAITLRGIYNPVYRMATGNSLTPRSFKAIAPDSPDLPSVEATLDSAGVK
ncbi:MAG: hypothetical protein VKP62_09925 [Candidatus Sericytochromatia bacterium]|nr:hypothetical protein [Candidatus Sericytochromatia bacterium]